MAVFDQLSQRNPKRLLAAGSSGPCKRFRLSMEDGKTGQLDAYELFEGITLLFNSIPRGVALWDDMEPQELQFDWCRSGRFELETADGGSLHLNEGELAAHDQRVRKARMSYPMPLYTGFTLRIEYARGSRALMSIPVTEHIDFDLLRERYTGAGGCKIVSPDRALADLLASFWHVDRRETLNRLQLKTLELLVLLYATEQPAWKMRRYPNRSASEPLLKAARLLEEDLSSDLSLEQVACTCGMSASAFKERFSRTWGIAPMSYRRRCRIEQAALLLSDTHLSVSEIASRVGYRNASKFSAAFRKRYRMSPSEWRKEGRRMDAHLLT